MAQKKVKLPAGEAVQTQKNIAEQLDRLAMRRMIIGTIHDVKNGQPLNGLRWSSPDDFVLGQYTDYSDVAVVSILEHEIHHALVSRDNKIAKLQHDLAYTKKLLADMECARAEASNIRDELRSIILDALNRPR